MTDLGMLGGAQVDSESGASGINNAGQVVGWSSPDATNFSSNSIAPDEHAFLWQNGAMTDLGTLGGTPDNSAAFAINNAGQVVGWSDITPLTGTDRYSFEHAFLWQNGTMTDLGLGRGSR